MEFSRELAAVARQNISRVGVSAEILETDACQFNPLDGHLLIYMYNPFGSSVMYAVVRNLLAWRQRSAKMAFVVYVNPPCEKVLESFPEFELVASANEARVWKMR